MEFSVLASSSKGNCTVVRAGETTLLVDCGLSARDTARRLESVGYGLDSIDAIIITHEHSDHIRGLPVLSKKYQLPVFVTAATCSASPELLAVPNERVEGFICGEPFSIGSFIIDSFPVRHDAADPVGLRIYYQSQLLVIATDLGTVDSQVKAGVDGATGLVIESNHDPELLYEAPYPWSLKNRIKSDVGHLSNQEAARLVRGLVLAGKSPEVVVAGHISENSNCPELVREEFEQALQPKVGEMGAEFYIAGPKEPTPLYRLGS